MRPNLKAILGSLYVRVLIAIALGVLVGALWPATGVALKPLGDAFIKLIKMLIAPIVFLTVSIGIANMGDMQKIGRVGLKALVYFEVVTTGALAIGLVVAELFKPGAGINANPASIDTSAIASYTQSAHSLNAVDFLLNIIPNNFVDAFAKGDILQVLLVAVLFGFALSGLGDRVRPLVSVVEQTSQAFFGIVAIIVQFAPVGAFGAMAFTIGKFGLPALISLGKLMAGVYTTCILFVLLVLGGILRTAGLSIFKFLAYIKDEIFIVLGTSSSESALPLMMEKMEHLGCDRSVVGLVIPSGYSFNLDGTSIYLTMATLFIAQAMNVPLSLSQELTILLVLLLTSKGAAAVTGGGFITLAATLASVGTLPVAGLVLLLGVDRFMSEARAITNLIGNGVATIMVARWEREFDDQRARRLLNGEPLEESPAQPLQ